MTFEALRFETDLGTFTAILFPEAAPETVAFYKRLVESGYYDGREFNRVIPGFVVQEVDRAGGATDQTETVTLEAGTSVHFSMGAIGVARSEDPESGGSEFFVMDFAHSHLYGNYTAFAQVVEGLEVVHAIARVQTVATGPASTLPLPAPVAVHDRVAVKPAKIATASVVEVVLPADVAAQYPRVVGNRTVVDTTRYTPEWPADLRAGRAAAMTWFVYTPPDAAVPDLSGALARVVGPDGATLDAPFVPDAADPRILHWSWVPALAGTHTLALVVGGNVVAENTVDVR